MKRNLEVITELKKQGKALLDARREEFVRQNLLSDEFLNFVQENRKPFNLLMSYYECAIMEIETKFKVLNHELSLEYDANPIESIKTRVKSYDSILKKIRRKNIALNLDSIEENLRDIAGVRVICSFPDDIYKLAESFLKQDDITLIERKDYIKNPKPSGYRSLHLIVQVPIFLQNEKKKVNVEVQFRTIAMDFWASLDHKMRYKKELSDEEVEILQEELYDCARQSAALDERMQRIRNRITQKRKKEVILLEDQHDKC
ncbi:GTP pyrophosphokinase family protein [Anaerostipes hadrus]|nr:GTP pyrophosphokinase family protein [Anaerostipes hadrus]